MNRASAEARFGSDERGSADQLRAALHDGLDAVPVDARDHADAIEQAAHLHDEGLELVGATKLVQLGALAEQDDAAIEVATVRGEGENLHALEGLALVLAKVSDALGR